jgi:RNA recognition motif-containing protein
VNFLRKKIAFSKTKSDIISKKEGNFDYREGKRKRNETDSEDPRLTKSLAAVGHHILYAQNLPAECTQEMLSSLFSQCIGFQEVRVPPGNRGIAFIEFDDATSATLAHKQLNGFQVSQTYQLDLNFRE